MTVPSESNSTEIRCPACGRHLCKLLVTEKLFAEMRKRELTYWERQKLVNVAVEDFIHTQVYLNTGDESTRKKKPASASE